MEKINEHVSQNLIALRKHAKLTQLEFAEKLNYSDKSVSKWENGESIPSVEVLVQICEFFNVSLDAITKTVIEKTEIKKKKMSANKLIIVGLSMLCACLLVTIAYVSLKIVLHKSFWILFVWAVPLCSIIGIVFNSIWGERKNLFYIISLLIWSILAGVYLIFIQYNIWIIFLLGVPLQISVILWSRLKVKKQ